MKRIVMSLAMIAIVSVVAVGATRAYFVDTETVTGNTFAAGSLDLEFGTTTLPFSVDGLMPGDTSTSCIALTNSGTIDGNLTLSIDNPVSNENDLLEPEIDAGDSVGVEVDNTGGGFDQNDGDGELWDQLSMFFFVDQNDNEAHDWGEPEKGIGQLDLSSSAHIDLGENLFPFVKKPTHNDGSYEHTLSTGDEATLCMNITFTNDEDFWSAFGGLTNNMAMDDDVVFDINFGLSQVQD